MGSPTTEVGRKGDEVQVAVTITRGFWMKATEVTQAEWVEAFGTNPSRFKCGDECPVENVSWVDAVRYVNFLSTREGLPPCYSSDGAEFYGLDCHGYRLPTEAEWEYAARADMQNGAWEPLDVAAWFKGNSDKRTQPVAQKAANRWGLYDMLGNVWEWVHDVYDAERRRRTIVDPRGPDSGMAKVARGGGWESPTRHVRFAARRSINLRSALHDVGLRPVRTIP